MKSPLTTMSIAIRSKRWQWTRLIKSNSIDASSHKNGTLTTITFANLCAFAETRRPVRRMELINKTAGTTLMSKMEFIISKCPHVLNHTPRHCSPAFSRLQYNFFSFQPNDDAHGSAIAMRISLFIIFSVQVFFFCSGVEHGSSHRRLKKCLLWSVWRGDDEKWCSFYFICEEFAIRLSADLIFHFLFLQFKSNAVNRGGRYITDCRWETTCDFCFVFIFKTFNATMSLLLVVSWERRNL